MALKKYYDDTKNDQERKLYGYSPSKDSKFFWEALFEARCARCCERILEPQLIDDINELDKKVSCKKGTNGSIRHWGRGCWSIKLQEKSYIKQILEQLTSNNNYL